MRERWKKHKIEILIVFAVGVVLVLIRAATAGSGGGGGSGLEDQSAEEILASSRDAYQAATSVRIQGTVPLDTGVTTLDLRLTQGGDAQVVVTANGITMELIQLGDQTWFRSPQALTQISPELAAAVGDRWVLITQGSQTQRFADVVGAFADKGSFVEQLFSIPLAGKEAGVTVGGVAAVGLKDSQGGVLYIATTGEPFPLLAETRDQSTRLEFSSYNQDLGIRAPENAINDIDRLIASTLAG